MGLRVLPDHRDWLLERRHKAPRRRGPPARRGRCTRSHQCDEWVHAQGPVRPAGPQYMRGRGGAVAQEEAH
eukprot:932773-Pyramimonas_sp.AAC.1